MSRRLTQWDVDRLKAACDFAAMVRRDVPDLKRDGTHEWRGTCPFHGGRSLTVRADKRFFKCFGCGKSGDPIAWLMDLHGLDFVAAIEALGGDVEVRLSREAIEAQANTAAARRREEEREAAKAIERARALWADATAIDGTPAATYLAGRGIAGPYPPSLRYHPKIRGKWQDRDGRDYSRTLPAMLGAVQGADGRVVTVHRTYLPGRDVAERPGKGYADVPKAKKLYSGPMGGAIRLGPVRAPGLLILTEGIETGLAVLAAMRGRDGFAVWSCISAPGLVGLVLPDGWRPRRVVIMGDHDESGAGEIAGANAARRLRTLYGVPDVRFRMPDRPGADWLDVLTDQEQRKGRAA